MARDILDLAEAPGDHRLTVLSDRSLAAPENAELDARPRGALYMVLTALALMVPAGFGYHLWSTAGRVDLVFQENPIVNAPEMLAAAETVLTNDTAVDGTPASDASCFFAPSTSAPTVVCGPVWFGVSSAERPWVELNTTYMLTDGGASGAVAGIRGTLEVEPKTLERPDGIRPAAIGAPQWPTAGTRFANGTLLLDPSRALATAEAALPDLLAAEETEYTLAESPACYLAQGPALQTVGVPETNQMMFCGPARTATSGAEETWLPISLNYLAGPTFGTVEVESASHINPPLRSLEDGVVFVRPDGTTPAVPITLDRPPRAADFSAVFVQRLIPESQSAARPKAVLVTSQSRVVFDGLYQVEHFGQDDHSFTAADGHHFVVATITASESSLSIRGTLMIDGAARPLPQWPATPDGGTLVVSVPDASRDVRLIAEDGERPQSLSLIDGSHEPTNPLALYREPNEVMKPFSLRLDMPAGEALLVDGSISSVTWSSRNRAGEWLDPGRAEAVVIVDGLTVDHPCCEVRVDNVATRFELRDPPSAEADGATGAYPDVRDDPLLSPGWESPRFNVSEDLDAAVLRVEVTASVASGDQASVVVATVDVPLDLLLLLPPELPRRAPPALPKGENEAGAGEDEAGEEEETP